MEQQGNNNNNNTEKTQSTGPTNPTHIQPDQPSSDTAIPYGIPQFRVAPPGELTFDQMMNHYRKKNEKLHEFWAGQLQEVESLSDFRNHSLPLARIKKIMKADEDVKMISGEVPVLFAHACEMFILELTLRGWGITEEHKRRTLQKNDISTAIAGTDIFDFLVDIVPRVDAGPVNRGASSSNPPPFVSGAYREVCGYYYGPHVDIVPDDPRVFMLHHHHHHHQQDQQPVYAEQRPRAYVVARHLLEQLDQGEVLNEQEPQKPSNDS